MSITYEYIARIWDVRTGEPIGKPLQHKGPIYAADFDPRGERVLTASEDLSARLWRAPPTGEALVEKIRSILGRHAPEPLKVPGDTSAKRAYGAVMVKGVQTLMARVTSLFRSH